MDGNNLKDSFLTAVGLDESEQQSGRQAEKLIGHTLTFEEILMEPIHTCQNLDEVRANIDRIDARLVSLIAERGAYVAQAAQFKNSADDVRAESRVDQVIAKIRRLAKESHADPELVEDIWRTMITHFTNTEMKDFTRR